MAKQQNEKRRSQRKVTTTRVVAVALAGLMVMSIVVSFVLSLRG